MSDTPIQKRIAELRLFRNSEEAEELSFLEEYAKWKADGGPEQLAKEMERKRQEEARQLMNRDPKRYG